MTVAIWFFLIYNVANPEAPPLKSPEFRWWVDCEDARAAVFFRGALTEPGPRCVQGAPTAMAIPLR